MEGDWDWKNKKINLKERGRKYELWRIWWSICTTRIEGKVR